MRIVYWILANKEWLFSGIGVVVILVGVGFVRRRLLSGRETSGLVPAAVTVTLTDSAPALPPIPQASLPQPPIFTKPSLDEIHSQIHSLPPFQQKGASDAYNGLKVCWKAVFADIDENEKNKFDVMLRQPDHRSKGWSGIIYCKDIDISAHPRLKFAHAGEQVIVRGTIASVGDLAIHLRHATIDFV